MHYYALYDSQGNIVSTGSCKKSRIPEKKKDNLEVIELSREFRRLHKSFEVQKNFIVNSLGKIKEK